MKKIRELFLMIPYYLRGIVVFAIIVYIIVSNINKMPNRTDELCSYREENVLYEFAK